MPQQGIMSKEASGGKYPNRHDVSECQNQEDELFNISLHGFSILNIMHADNHRERVFHRIPLNIATILCCTMFSRLIVQPISQVPWLRGHSILNCTSGTANACTCSIYISYTIGPVDTHSTFPAQRPQCTTGRHGPCTI